MANDTQMSADSQQWVWIPATRSASLLHVGNINEITYFRCIQCTNSFPGIKAAGAAGKEVLINIELHQ